MVSQDSRHARLWVKWCQRGMARRWPLWRFTIIQIRNKYGQNVKIKRIKKLSNIVQNSNVSAVTIRFFYLFLLFFMNFAITCVNSHLNCGTLLLLVFLLSFFLLSINYLPQKCQAVLECVCCLSEIELHFSCI